LLLTFAKDEMNEAVFRRKKLQKNRKIPAAFRSLNASRAHCRADNGQKKPAARVFRSRLSVRG
jgi:hypothetical protein